MTYNRAQDFCQSFVNSAQLWGVFTDIGYKQQIVRCELLEMTCDAKKK